MIRRRPHPLANTSVTVRGTVVKVNNNIMGFNFGAGYSYEAILDKATVK